MYLCVHTVAFQTLSLLKKAYCVCVYMLPRSIERKCVCVCVKHKYICVLEICDCLWPMLSHANCFPSRSINYTQSTVLLTRHCIIIQLCVVRNNV